MGSGFFGFGDIWTFNFNTSRSALKLGLLYRFRIGTSGSVVVWGKLLVIAFTAYRILSHVTVVTERIDAIERNRNEGNSGASLLES